MAVTWPWLIEGHSEMAMKVFRSIQKWQLIHTVSFLDFSWCPSFACLSKHCALNCVPPKDVLNP